MSEVVAAGRVVTPERVLAPGWVEVDGAMVVGVGAGDPPRPPDQAYPGATVVPGFVDIHCHGGGGGSFQTGNGDEAARAAAAHLRHGTTSLVASLVTDTPNALTRSVESLADLCRDGLLAGVHLEGPWLSPAYAGAHDRDLLLDPDPAVLDRLLSAGDGAIRMVTLAPELDGALDLVRRVVDAGAAAAVGHTDASYDQTLAAIENGATVGTHLFNAMRGLHHRRPGPIAALLESPETSVELVGDGVHVHPALLRLAAGAKPGRTVLVTDAMAAAAAEDGDYELGPIRVEVRDGVARTPEGAIAGSTLTMADAVRHLVASGLSLVEAVRAASTTPAGALGLRDVGSLRAGARADLVVLDQGLRVEKVMRAGTWVC